MILIRHNVPGYSVENSIDESDVTSASCVVTSPTSKTFPQCPSHSLIPQHYGQGNRGTIASVSENDVSGTPCPVVQVTVGNGFVKQSDAPDEADGVKVVQIQDEMGSASPSTTTTSVNPPQAANLNDKSIDCK